MNIQIHKQFLAFQDKPYINEIITSDRWQFGHKSNNITDNRFWKIDVTSDPFFNNYLMNKVRNVTGDEFDVERIYFNGHTGGGTGNIHKDSEVDNGRTFLVYCNDTWKPEFGGSTCFIHDANNIEQCYPYPNSAIYFQNNVDHFAAPISKDFNGLRVTLAFKLYKK